MYCLVKGTQRSWQIPAQRWAWKFTLRPKQREAPLNRTGPTPARPITMQLCPFMVAACLMTLLWPGPDTPTKQYPHLTEEDMPRIKQCFFGTLGCLQQSTPQVVELKWTPPRGNSPTSASNTTPRRHHARHMTQPTASAPARTRDTRESARAHPTPEPAPSSSLPTAPSNQHLPPGLRAPAVPQVRLLHHRLHPGPPAVPHIHLFRLGSTTSTPTTTLSTSGTTPSPSTPPPKPPAKLSTQAPKPVPVASTPATAKATAAPRPATGKAGRQQAPGNPAQPKAQPPSKATTKQPAKPAATPRPAPPAKPKPKPKPSAKPAARTQPPADVLHDLRPLPSKA